MTFGTGSVKALVMWIMSRPGSHWPSVETASFQWESPPEKSKPPQKPRPAPRGTITRTSGSRFAAATPE